MGAFHISNFLIVAVLAAASWSIVTALTTAGNLFLVETLGLDEKKIKTWLLIALIYMILAGILLVAFRLNLADVLGVTIKGK